ncbi:DUF4261 domain-containing protein [Allorhodopirellula solitaria]|uniref:DUF4261 domain-containing protein n=1 Tax=Allorhodopirellula solitaria TaxID=2527987 RepID=A0A5C5YI23_9BACT|nr:DUF4261 domain-containing protein [Allorhodopirellula solitaria]TWT74072.1 hypothetical protein CA85_09580 [Allorhodopirellula solitaria]
MAKGLFTQGMCVLLKRPLSSEEIQRRLQSFQLAARQESDDAEAPETLVYEFRPQTEGHLLVTPADAPWPDDMGDPDESPERFVAWSLGQYGPLAFPGGLQRAAAQSWGWEGAAEAVQEHTAHVRLLISYILGTEEGEDDDEDDLPLVPHDYDAMAELQALTRAVTALLESPEALCYFNPGGEILRDADLLRQGLNHAWSHELPPLDMWTNVRIFTEDDGWVVMDTVGNGQFDLPDMEAVCRGDAYKPGDIESFLRHATLYLLAGDEDVCTGDTADGPGDLSWSAIECGTSLSDPPRPTIRWIPNDSVSPPEHLLDPGDDDLDEDFDELLDDDDDGESFLEDHEVRGGSIDDLSDDWEDGEDPPGSVPF